MEGTGKNQYQCTHKGCTSSFNRPYRLVQHLLAHNNIKAYECDVKGCSKSYASRSHLIRHVDSVHKAPDKDVVFSCPTCMKEYANRQNLKRHIKVHHTLKVTFSCDTCKLEFNKKHQLSAHMYGHTGIKAFSSCSCEKCDKEFVSLFEKKKHSKYHKTFTCEKCSEVFHQWSKYQKHLRKDHVKEEIYTCDSCGKTFKNRTRILRHTKLCPHSSRTFLCPYNNCNRTYSRNSNLRQHILMKHLDVKHECEICDARLCTKAKLREHIEKKHVNQTEKQPPKTKATGRKPRKDIGILKNSMALKVAGLQEAPQECHNLANELVEIVLV